VEQGQEPRSRSCPNPTRAHESEAVNHAHEHDRILLRTGTAQVPRGTPSPAFVTAPGRRPRLCLSDWSNTKSSSSTQHKVTDATPHRAQPGHSMPSNREPIRHRSTGQQRQTTPTHSLGAPFGPLRSAPSDADGSDRARVTNRTGRSSPTATALPRATRTQERLLRTLHADVPFPYEYEKGRRPLPKTQRPSAMTLRKGPGTDEPASLNSFRFDVLRCKHHLTSHGPQCAAPCMIPLSIPDGVTRLSFLATRIGRCRVAVTNRSSRPLQARP
jgi:hypothetical protein